MNTRQETEKLIADNLKQTVQSLIAHKVKEEKARQEALDQIRAWNEETEKLKADNLKRTMQGILDSGFKG